MTIVTNEYPECERLAEVQDKIAAIRNFCQFMGEQGKMFAGYNDSYHNGDRLLPDPQPLEKQLMAFFDIDTDRLEAERQHMLASLGQ